MTPIQSTVDSLTARLSQQGLDAYEVYTVSSSGLTIEIKDGEIDVFARRENSGLSLRVLKEQRLGFVYSTVLSPEAGSELIDCAVNGAAVADPDPFWGFPGPSSEPLPELDQFDRSLGTIPLDTKIDKARHLEAAARSSDPRITKVRKAAYTENTVHVTVCNHAGIRLTYSKTSVSGSVMAVAEERGEAETGWDFGFSPFFHQLHMDSIGKTAAERAVSLLGSKPIKSMSVPALLPPWIASDVLGVLSSSFMADNVQKGKSLLIGRKGEQVFSPYLTILDDGLHPGGIGSSPADDEGSPCQRSVLVSEGVVKGFLYDQYTANKEKVRSTGNAGRHGIKAPPTVQATNFYVQKGSESPNGLLSSLGRGLMVTDIIGLHTADPISGDFSVGAAGLWIEDGVKRFPVKGIALSGNLIDLFNKVDGVGSDLKFYGSFGAPSLRVSELDIAGLNG